MAGVYGESPRIIPGNEDERSRSCRPRRCRGSGGSHEHGLGPRLQDAARRPAPTSPTPARSPRPACWATSPSGWTAASCGTPRTSRSPTCPRPTATCAPSIARAGKCKKSMHSHERILALLEGRPVDCLPLMPITMMFAADQTRRALRPLCGGPSRDGRGPTPHGREVRLRLRFRASPTRPARRPTAGRRSSSSTTSRRRSTRSQALLGRQDRARPA